MQYSLDSSSLDRLHIQGKVLFHPHRILNPDSNDKNDHYISALERDLRQFFEEMNSAA